MKLALLASVIFPPLASASAAAAPPPPPFDCTFSASYPRQYVAPLDPFDFPLDGDVLSPSKPYASAPWSEAFVDITGNASLAPRFDTRVKMTYTEKYLYVAAFLQEPQVWANLTSDNTIIYYDNDFEVFVDPSATTHAYKETEINAFAKVWDLFLNMPYNDGGYENSSRVMDPAFDMIPSTPSPLHRGVTVYGSGPVGSQQQCLNVPGDGNCRGWGVELALPVDMLLVNSTGADKPREGGIWRINFSRVEWRVVVDGETGAYAKDPSYPDEDNWVWSPQGRVNMHLPDKWGLLQFGGPAAGPQPPSSYYESWPARQLAMQIYYAQHSYSASLGGSDDAGSEQYFTDDIASLKPFATIPGSLDGQCWMQKNARPPAVTLLDGGDAFVAKVELDGFVATVDNKRFLQVSEKQL